MHTVAQYQAALTSAGYDAGPADNLKGPATDAAIIKYRVAKGLSPYSATIDSALDSSLFPQPKGTLEMNLSILTLLIHYLPLLPFLEGDYRKEAGILTSSADGQAKLSQTLVVLKDLIAQIEAATAGQTIPQ